MTSLSLPKQKYLTNDEHQALNNRLQSLLPFETRNAAFVALLLHTGARQSEILLLRPKDLDPQTNKVYITGTKRSHNREIPIPVWLFEALISLTANAKLIDGELRIFPFKRNRARQIYRSLTLTPDKTAHALRHTKAMRILRKTGSPSIVKTGLGHKSFNSTQVYINHLASEQDMEKFLE